jgi:outer membrane protein assembly factor BamB
VGKKCSGGKEAQELPKGDNNDSAAIMPESLKEGLVAYYPFNGNAKDESGNGHDGEALNRVSLTTDRNGIDGKAYYFNNVWSRIRIPDSASWKVSPITISAWVNAKSIGERSPCFISSANPADGIGFSIGVSSEGKLYYWVGVDEVRRVNGVRTFTNEDMELDKWHHLLMTYGQNTATLYVNGNPVHSLKAGTGILYKNNRGSVTKLLIGRHNDERNRGAQWSGSIDDVRIYNRALSEAEVKELYNLEKPSGETAANTTKPGTLLWEFQTGDKVSGTSPAIGSDGTVYIGSDDGKVYAMDGKSGAKKWEFKTWGYLKSSPAIGPDGTVYVGSWDHKVYALDGKTGAKLWDFETKAKVSCAPTIGTDGTVYIGSDDNNVYALNGQTGTKKWEFKTGGDVVSAPAIGDDGTVYFGSVDKKLYALDGKSGAKKWEFETGRTINSSPAIGPDGIIYIGATDKKIYAFASSSKGPAKSPWPMRGQNAQHTGRKIN